MRCSVASARERLGPQQAGGRRAARGCRLRRRDRRTRSTVSATLTASPVPRCTRCSTNSTGTSVTSCSCSVFVDPLGAVADHDHDPLETAARRARRPRAAPSAVRTAGAAPSACPSACACPRRRRARRRRAVGTGSRSPCSPASMTGPVWSLARGRGFEPRLRAPKDPVLPLHHPRLAGSDGSSRRPPHRRLRPRAGATRPRS